MTEFSFSHVNKNFGFKPVLKDLSFEVMTGERAALIGRNGTGKSTILKLLASEESPDSGEISLRRGANTALLEQIPRLRGKDATVYDVLCEPFAEVFSVEAKLRELEEKMTEDFERYADAYTEAQSRYAALGGYDAETRLKNIVQGFKLNSLLERPYNVLSGGQKTVVNLAAVVLREPDILLLDEPTNHLDMQTLDWFEGFLAKYRGTVLMVSHDRRFLDRVATRTLILEDGICTSYPGGYTAAKEEQERQMLLEFEQYKNQQKQIEANKPKVLFAEAVSTSQRCCLVSELAKIISQNGVAIGQNRLFAWMRKNGYLCNKGQYYNQPTQKAMELGLFEIKKTTITKPSGDVIVNTTSKVTGKGQIYFVNKFIGKEEPDANQL